MSVNLPVLIVHQDGAIRDRIAETLGQNGQDIRVASDWQAALRIFETERPWLIVSDLSLGSADAKSFVEAVSFRGSTQVFCVTSKPADPREITRVVRAGATELFEFPRDLAEIGVVADATSSGSQAERPAFDADRPATLEGVRVQARLEQRRRLADALRSHDGNITQVAKRLGCSRQAVYDRMRRLRLKKEDYAGQPSPSRHTPNDPRLVEQISILVIEDEETRRNEIGAFLSDAGLEVRLASDCHQGWEILQRFSFDCVLTDFKTPRMSGLELIEHVRESGSRVPIILLTAYRETSLTVAAMKRGAQSVFNYDKDLSWTHLVREIADQVATHRKWVARAESH